MELLLDVLLFLARVVLVMYCVRHTLFLLTGTSRTYAEWTKGVGGFLYIAGVVIAMANLHHLVPGRDISRVMNSVGLALVVLPTVLRYMAPRTFYRLTQLEDC